MPTFIGTEQETLVGADRKGVRLIRMSRKNKCFLFEDDDNELLKVYKLERHCHCCDDLADLKEKGSCICCKMFLNQNQICKCGCQKYEFQVIYYVDVFKLKMAKRHYRGAELSFRSIMNHITQRGQIKVDDDGNIDIIFNDFNPQDNSDSFSVFVSILRVKEGINLSKWDHFDEYYFKR